MRHTGQEAVGEANPVHHIPEGPPLGNRSENEGLLRDAAEIDLRQFRHRMGLRQHRHQLARTHRHADDIGMLEGADEEAHVDAAIEDQGALSFRPQVIQHDVDVGKFVAERPQDSRQRPADGEVHVADGDRPEQALGGLARGQKRVLGLLDEHVAVVKKNLAGGSERNVPRRAHHEGNAHFAFDEFDEAAQLRLSHVEALRRAAKMQGFGEHDKGAVMLQLKIHWERNYCTAPPNCQRNGSMGSVSV